jgi:hypothetical protein
VALVYFDYPLQALGKQMNVPSVEQKLKDQLKQE